MNGINKLTAAFFFYIISHSQPIHAIEFNTDVLDVADKTNIDFSRFSRADYVMPGDYIMSIFVNEQSVSNHDQHVPFYPDPRDNQLTLVCLPVRFIDSLGLTEAAAAKITQWHQGECADLSALKGATIKGDVSAGRLQISIPQAWMEYNDPDWLPPSRWDNGVPGILLDYNLNVLSGKSQGSSSNRSASLSGTAGANFGPWRLRGDYQGSNSTSSDGPSQTNFEFNRLYAYRALPGIKSSLTMGENYFLSDIFDSFRFIGASLASDERMLPPNLRGYAPEVRGIARTNARVTVSQQGRVLYQTTVASGPFAIRDLNSAVSGSLDVKVEEQDGSQQIFSVDTANIPYLTRPGSLRYKAAVGRPSTYQHDIEGPVFSSGEFSYGMANSWSLYGGGIGTGDYHALSLGIGRDLFQFGALSADVTHSMASLHGREGNKQGKSYRLSYAKRFDKLDSEVTFAGYRFSERDYLSMGQYLDARYHESDIKNSKQMFTITANKSFIPARISLYLSYSHQSYWTSAAEDRYSLSVSRYFDFMDRKNISLNLSATRSEYQKNKNDALFISLLLPLGNGASVGYDGQASRDNYSQSVSYSDNVNNSDNYRLSTGLMNRRSDAAKSQFNGYYTHRGDMAELSLNAGYAQDSYRSAGFSVQGGLTATLHGAAVHPSGRNGGTRLMLNTDGVSGVPIENTSLTSNYFGIAVLTDVNSYYRTDTRIDISQLADDVEASKSVVEATLTEGAIGYRKFALQQGIKALAVIRMTGGNFPPFGASVVNKEGREMGIVSDGGLVYLTGLQPGQTLGVAWSGAEQCSVEIPKTQVTQGNLLLPCRSINQ